MRYERKKKAITLGLLLVVVCGISVGFAAFSSTLRIKPTAAISPDPGDFSIKFSSSSTGLVTDPVKPSSKSAGLETTDATITNSASPLISGYSATFTEDGQYVTYSFYVRNVGAYTAYLNSITYVGSKECSAISGTNENAVNYYCSGVDTRTTVKVGSVTTTATKTDITGETLAPGESKLVEVTFEYLGGGSIVPGDFSIEFSPVTLYYASTTGLNKPQDDPGRYKTSTSTTDTLVLSDVKSTPLKNCKIYGSSAGIGDSNGGGYVIPVTVRGKNILDPSQITASSGYYSDGAGSAISNSNFSYLKPIKVEPNTTYTLTANISRYSIWFTTTNAISATGNISNIRTGTFTTPDGCQYIKVSLRGDVSTFDWAMLELGEGDGIYESYVEPTTYNIAISSPLMAGDYIDFESQKVVRSNGTKETISIPEITTLSVPTTIIEVGTINVPSKIEATYFK